MGVDQRNAKITVGGPSGEEPGLGGGQRDIDHTVFAAEARTALFLHHADDFECHVVDADGLIDGKGVLGEELLEDVRAEHGDTGGGDDVALLDEAANANIGAPDQLLIVRRHAGHAEKPALPPEGDAGPAGELGRDGSDIRRNHGVAERGDVPIGQGL